MLLFEKVYNFVENKEVQWMMLDTMLIVAGLVKVTGRKVPYAYACFLFNPYWDKILWNSDAY